MIVGDANGADKAVQKFLLKESYQDVTVFFSGDSCRNNLGKWEIRSIHAPKSAKGFEFYAAKDREMAREADFGLMIWDGKSIGTILNILRLLRAGKKAVLLNVPENDTTTFKAINDWVQFISQVNSTFRNDLRKRATAEEWISWELPQQAKLFDSNEPSPEPSNGTSSNINTEEMEATINSALAKGDAASLVHTLGNIAKARGMSQVAKDTGLARESLYRSLSVDGNPEFTTVLKVLLSMGLRLKVDKISEKKAR